MLASIIFFYTFDHLNYLILQNSRLPVSSISSDYSSLSILNSSGLFLCRLNSLGFNFLTFFLCKLVK